jgi:glycosyltransferase-like protein LARGE
MQAVPSAPQPLPPGSIDVTVVTQTSPDRIWKLKELCRIWKGPISVAIYVAPEKLEDARAEVARSACGPKMQTSYFLGNQPDKYPFNALRNRARQGVSTSHLFNVDIDLWPSHDTYATLLRLLREPWAASRKAALVVPVFATGIPDVSRIPLTVEMLSPCVINRLCYTFDGHPDIIPDHQLTTNYPEWFRRSTTPALAERAVYKIPCLDTSAYEPYVVVPNLETTPLFDERFVGEREPGQLEGEGCACAVSAWPACLDGGCDSVQGCMRACVPATSGAMRDCVGMASGA